MTFSCFSIFTGKECSKSYPLFPGNWAEVHFELARSQQAHNSFATMMKTMAAMKSLLLIATVLLLSTTVYASEEKEEEAHDPNHHYADLLSHKEDIRVLGPTSFPKPTDKIRPRGAIPVVKPLHGTHRPDVDAVFAYAEGYGVPYYMHFIETLQDTGFDGDIVLAIAEERLVERDVLKYLQTRPNVVVYSSDMDCFDDDRVRMSPRKKTKQGHLDIFQMCLLHQVYGWVDEESGKVKEKAQDPREGRVVATLRYEWYWIWLQHYNNNQWIMVLDARDSFFQSNPFVDLPRKSDPKATQGTLYFFGENAEATRLGKSTKNVNWLKNGYGAPVLDAVREKPTICSGSTMGEVVAMEQYLRALVNEKDETEVRMTGSDQGFHNYLYYSHKLANVHAIQELVVWEQGYGIINNLGAMRKKPLEEWGMYNATTHQVYNWDGKLSPVVHQWDRDQDLFRYLFHQKLGNYKSVWHSRQKEINNNKAAQT